MAGKRVRWTTEAKRTFDNILSYLQENWSEREIRNFARATDHTISVISKHPHSFRRTNISKVHEALISRYNLLIYKVYPTYIDLLTFWDIRQNPRKKNY